MIHDLPVDIQIHILSFVNLSSALNWSCINRETYHELIPLSSSPPLLPLSSSASSSSSSSFSSSPTTRHHHDQATIRLWLPLIQMKICQIIFCFCLPIQTPDHVVQQHCSHLSMMMVNDEAGNGQSSSSITPTTPTTASVMTKEKRQRSFLHNLYHQQMKHEIDKNMQRKAIHRALVQFSKQCTRISIDYELNFRGLVNMRNMGMFAMLPGSVYEWSIVIHESGFHEKGVALVGVETDHFNFGDMVIGNKIGGLGSYGLCFDLDRWCFMMSGKRIKPYSNTSDNDSDENYDDKQVVVNNAPELNNGDVITVRFDMRASSESNDRILADVLGIMDGRAARNSDNVKDEHDSILRQFHLIETLGANFQIYLNQSLIGIVPCIIGQRFHAAISTNGFRLRDFSVQPASRTSKKRAPILDDDVITKQHFDYFVRKYGQTLQSDVFQNAENNESMLHCLTATNNDMEKAVLVLLADRMKRKFH